MSKRKRKHQKRNKNRSRKTSVPSAERARRLTISPNMQSLVAKLHADELIHSLKRLFESAAEISFTLRDCSHFSLLDESHLEPLKQNDERAHYEWFWTQINQLLVLLSRSNSRAILSLIAGFVQSLESHNELTLAFCSRALIEHAAASNFLQEHVDRAGQQIRKQAYPPFLSTDPIVKVSDDDEAMRQFLLCFAVGRLVQIPDEEVPLFSDNNEKWKKFTKAMRKVPTQFIPFRIGEMIDSMVETPGRQFLRPAYNLLSEYCHPNSSSRTLDFNVAMTSLGKHHLFAQEGDVSVGFLKIITLCQQVIPVVCVIIENALQSLSRSHMPVPKMRIGSPSPFLNAIRVVDDYGRIGWVSQQTVIHVPGGSVESLTSTQLERIKRIHNASVDVYPVSLEVTLKNFASEGAYIDEEIALWEHFINVFNDEVALRKSSKEERTVLFLAIVASLGIRSSEELESIEPLYKKVTNLQRVIDKVNTP